MLFINGRSTPRTTLLVPHPGLYDFLYSLALEAGEAWVWQGKQPSSGAFQESLASAMFHAVVVDRQTHAPLGYVAFDKVNLFHQTAYMRCYISAAARGLGYPLEGVGLMIDELFNGTPIRKLYAESPAPRHLQYFAGSAFQEVARLPEHVRVGRDYVDLVISCIDRAHWSEVGAPFIKRIDPLSTDVI